METQEKKKGIKEIYNELSVKYNLPSYEDLNKEFEIWNISPKNPFILREIRRAMVEKFEDAARYLERILYTPDASLMDLYESSIFKKQELQKVFTTFRKLAKAIRDSDILEFESYNEEKEAEWIRKYFKIWLEIKKEIVNILIRKRDFWKREIKYKSPKEYVG